MVDNSTNIHWMMVNNSTNINKNHLSPQYIEWWSTISPISTKITSHFNSLSDVNNSTNINKNHLSPLYIEWWSTIPPISTKITSHLNSLGDGQQFHQYQQTSPLTLTHWMMVNNSTNINKNHLSPQLIEWWSTIPPISTKITSHFNSLSDVNNSTNINKNHLSLQLIEWWSTIPPISTKITSHFNSLGDGQQFHQYQQKSPLTLTHWMMVNNSTNINKNHLSPKLHWVMVNNFHQYQPKSHLTSTHWVMSTIPPISTKITSHFNSLNDVNNSTNINKNHLSPQLIEWWSTIPPISTKITSHLNSLSDGQQFHQYQQKSPLTSTHWMMVNNSTNINKNHLSPQYIEWWSTIPPISTKITSHLNSLGDGQQFHQYQQTSPLTYQLIEWWSTIPPISTKITSHYQLIEVMVNNSTNINKNHFTINSLNDGQQFHQYQQKSPLTSTHWVMVNNSTNINKNHLSPQLIEWWSTIPPISTKITSHLNSLSDGQQFHQYQQKSPLISTHWVMSTIPPISTKINFHFNSLNDGQQFHQYQQKKSPLTYQLIEWWSTIPPISTKITPLFNSLSDGQKFHQYQQKSPLTLTHWVMVNNFTNINKITSHHYSLSDCQQFHQYQQQSPLTTTH